MAPVQPVLLSILLLFFSVGRLIHAAAWEQQPSLQDNVDTKIPKALQVALEALEVMQDQYFDIFSGNWPSAIDWTAAVMGTHVSAMLSTLVSSFETSSTSTCVEVLEWQNLIDRYFAQTSLFYFGENAFQLRYQAYDDMLWVVLGWLENIKFVEAYAQKHRDMAKTVAKSPYDWHGLQFSPMAAHRARIFYQLASAGWDDSLCNGGMTWNPRLTPYKNAITNELFISASVSMYLYHPGDNNSSPYIINSGDKSAFRKPHAPVQLENAIKAYKWLKGSRMQSPRTGLYQDGFHIRGWRRYPNGTIFPGTGNCDDLNTMVYTYNQGVLLTAHRGLWVSTAARSYLDDGHELVDSVLRATGWPSNDRRYHGLGRNGVLEDFCDHAGHCSQDGQTFKGLFFHHLAEFCRPLAKQEQEFMEAQTGGLDQGTYRYHQARCAAYGAWIRHNAQAALMTADGTGRYGMWWGRAYPYPVTSDTILEQEKLPDGAIDYVNEEDPEAEKYGMDLQPNGGRLVQRHDWQDVNDRGRGRTVETQSGGLAVLRANWQWESSV